jgi:glycosyltransferase involved in cell wall biosynthesis
MAAERPTALTGAAPASWRKLLRLTARESRVWRAAAGYITLTRVHQQELEDRFGMRANSAVIPDGVRLDPARTLQRPPPPPFTVTYAGHLYPWKGVDVLLSALAELPHVQARIVGGQPGETDHVRLDRVARDKGVSDRVTFTGWLPPASVAAELARAHALVLPNTPTLTSERYTSPLKLFEYLAAGRPIVASDLPALREVLRQDDNALLVEPGSPSELAAALRRVMGDQTLAAGLSRRAFDDAAYYGWATRAQRIDVVLDAARALP